MYRIIPTIIYKQLDIGCPRISNEDETLTCMDGTRCMISGNDSSCCVAHGGTTNCPKSKPVLCSAPKACGSNLKERTPFGDDYCCARHSDHCAEEGAGNPICINGKNYF